MDTKKRLNDYEKEYNHFINNIYYSKKRGTRAAQIQRAENFENDIFENRTIFEHNPYFFLQRELFNQIAKETEDNAALAKLSSLEGDIESVQQFHQNLFGSCKSCHSRFRD